MRPSHPLSTAICPIDTTLAVIGGKWKSIILFHLLAKPVLRFHEFQKIMPAVTPQMLSRQLRELESDGLIHRKVYAQVPPKVEYRLTNFGETLKPVILAMKKWGLQYAGGQHHTFAPEDR
jgi:DNA-binding HxlR family transcriptional regulator